MASWLASLFLALLLSGWTLPAGERDIVESGRPSLRVFTDKDGLPQNTVEAIKFDAKGYLWIGTQDGAVRYDGHAWTTLDMPESHLGNWVACILPTQDGSLWIGRNNGGISRWFQGAWTRYDLPEGLPASRVHTLVEGAGTLWAGTSQGPARLQGDRWIPITNGAEWTHGTVRSLIVKGDAEQPELWVGAELGLGHWHQGKWTWITEADGLPSAFVNTLLEEPLEGGGTRLWVGTQKGLAWSEGGSWSFTRDAKDLPNLAVYRLFRTRNGAGKSVLWVGTEGGLVRWELAQRRMWTPSTGLPNAVVRSLCVTVDPAGSETVWIGTFGGLVRVLESTWITFDRSQGLPDNFVWSLLETQDPWTYWIGTFVGLGRYRNGAWMDLGKKAGLPETSIFSLGSSREGGQEVIWAGTKGFGLYRIEGDWGVQVPGLLDSWVYSLLVDKTPEGHTVIWAGTRAGVSRLEGGRWTHFAQTARFPRVPVTALTRTRSSQGREVLWVGTRTAGIGALDLGSGNWTWIGVAQGLANHNVSNLLPVSEGGAEFVYAATMGGGLSKLRLEPLGQVQDNLTKENSALPSNIIYTLRKDATGNLYAFTNRGVARFRSRPEGGIGARVFTTGDGLPSNGCVQGASLVDSRGRIWAGTVAGAAVLDTSRLRPDAEPKPLYLDAAWSGAKALPLGQELQVGWRSSDLRLKLSLLSYRREEDSLFRTQLMGLERQPTEWTKAREREFPTLPGGTYTFRAWGMDHAGNLSGPVDMRVVVASPPWRRWWANLLYLALGGGILALGVRWRMRILHRRNDLLESLVAERTAEITHMNTELLVAKEHVERASEYKSTFLANMSHELRTPLNAILLYSELLQEDAREAGNAEAVGDLDRIRSSSRHLLTLINGILDLSKIEAGKMTLYLEDIDLGPLLADVAGTLQPLVDGKGNRLELLQDPSLKILHTDLTKLRQILYNLISNACKFTEKGTISLEIARVGEEAHFRVRDTGIGMTPEQLARLFHDFVQAEASTSSHYGGTGLGLTISQKICELMGGRITVESEAGIGTTFTVILPIIVVEPTEKEGEPAPMTGGGRKAKVLVIDDDPVMRDYLSRMLSREGYWVATASSGSEGLKLAQKLRPHIITLDVVMEGMDGWTVLGLLKADPNLRDIPVVLLTLTEDHTKGYALGAAEFLQKPVTGEDLARVLKLHTEGGPVPCVLVVEDDEITRSGLVAMFGRQSWRVLQAGNASEAIAQLELTRPDLILLDLLLPGMNGFALADELRHHPEWKHLPVVVLSSKDLSREEEALLNAAQVDRILTKGAHTKQELMEIVRTIVQERLEPATPGDAN